MGMRASGVLFWGVHYSADELAELFPDEDDYGNDGLMELAYALDSREEQAECPSPETPPGAAVDDAAWIAWRSRLDDWEASRCSVRRAGHCDNSEASYVYVRASLKEATWSEMEPVNSLEAPSRWREMLADYLAKLGLPWREPGWFLTSYYG